MPSALTRLERAILRRVVAGPRAWSRVRALVVKINRAHPEHVRRVITKLVDADLLTEWPLQGGTAVTLTQNAADHYGQLLGLGDHIKVEIYEVGKVERPRWRRTRKPTRRGIKAHSPYRPYVQRWLDQLELPASILAARLKAGLGQSANEETE